MNTSRSTFAPNPAGTQLDRVENFEANFIYDFWGNWQTGLAYMWGKVETIGRTKGEVNGVLARLWFFF